jgi:hypothetical protein
VIPGQTDLLKFRNASDRIYDVITHKIAVFIFNAMSASDLNRCHLFRVRTLFLEKSHVDFLRERLYNEAI